MDPQTIGGMEGGLIGIVIMVLIGAASGWLAGLILKGGGMGFLVNAVVGIIGAFIGGYLFGMMGISMGGGLLGVIITSTVGAILLLFVIGLFKKS